MKKQLACGILFVCLLALPGAVSAESEAITISINGQIVTPAEPPLMLSEHVYVPMRYVGEYLGAEVEYIAATEADAAHVIMTKLLDEGMFQRVTLYYGQHEVANDYTIDNKDYNTQGIAPQTMTLINGVSYVPLRTAAEALNCQVDWQSDRRTVVINELAVAKDALLAEIKWTSHPADGGDLKQDAEALKASLDEAKAQAESLKAQVDKLESSQVFNELADKKANGELAAKKEELEADKEKLAYWQQEIERLEELLK